MIVIVPVMSLCCRLPTVTFLDLTEFRQSVFEFAVGGRILTLWEDWSDITNDDRRHECSRSNVHDHCMEWPRTHPDLFEELAILASNFASCDLQHCQRKLDAHNRKEQGSELGSVVLSGVVSAPAGPVKHSSR